MKNLIIFLSCILSLASCVLKVNAQVTCPNIFKCGDTLVDIRDNYKYPTVQIGTQCWFQVNLHPVKYMNGDSIHHITNATAWVNLGYGAWCDYNNDAGNVAIYGHLYNWFAVNDNRSLCPLGWYVPTYNEWLRLFNYLGGTSVAGGALKETGTAYWTAPNTGANNSSGFSALPGGGRDDFMGSFYNLSYNGYWWSANASGGSGAWGCGMDFFDTDAYLGLSNNFGKAHGFAVRCLKDY